MNPASEWAVIEEREASKPVKVGLMRNGGSIKITRTKFDGEVISLSNTCAFDSVVQILATSYCDSKKLQEMYDSLIIDKIWFLATNL